MFILEEPYVSDFLKQTVVTAAAPVLDTPMARRVLAGTGLEPLPGEAFASLVAGRGRRLYANSENAIDWIAANLGDTPIPERIRVLKDKLAFRELLARDHPDHGFLGAGLDELETLDVSALGAPFVVKPSVGFFSLGVHKVHDHAHWPGTAAAVKSQARALTRQYPGRVLDTTRFVVEEAVPGQEFAVDAYFDAHGRAVVVNILAHLFASESDVSDRVYHTSAGIIRRWEEPFRQALDRVGELAGLADFPVHAELRVDHDGNMNFIEINPMRFAGWCTTDLAHFAWGLNPYLCYLQDRKPDWDRLLDGRQDRTFAIVVADLPPDQDLAAIARVDYEAFLARFTRPLELRKVDYSRYSVFAFLFVETPVDDLGELAAILGSDLSEFYRVA
jgi:hypothetical protein